ncbi:unnamed protein product [Staurois parvus]|uniref:Secreted protein n=1 Tax=Staurois parvus TaxID=386267 RepID=A0ABN9CZH4_9NEOB|nr:unnamed protein product [Staurois parvus]
MSPAFICLCVLPGSARHRDRTQRNTDRCTGPITVLLVGGDEDFFSFFFYTDCFYTHIGCKSNHFLVLLCLHSCTH